MLAVMDSRELTAWQAYLVWRHEDRKKAARDAAFDDGETVYW